MANHTFTMRDVETMVTLIQQIDPGDVYGEDAAETKDLIERCKRVLTDDRVKVRRW